MASDNNGTLYVGSTSNLIKRVYEHKNGLVDGFTKRYRVYSLVYWETYNDPVESTNRERQIKRWNRKWKIEMIEKDNKDWRDLYEDLLV